MLHTKKIRTVLCTHVTWLLYAHENGGNRVRIIVDRAMGDMTMKWCVHMILEMAYRSQELTLQKEKSVC